MVNGYPCFRILVFLNGFMNPGTIHSFAPVPGKKGGVNVNDPIREILNDILRDFP
jgi:hypothetical protein